MEYCKVNGCTNRTFNAEYCYRHYRELSEVVGKSSDTGAKIVNGIVVGFGDLPKSVGIEATLAERGSRYGEFKDHAVIAQDIQDAMRKPPGWTALAPDQKQALTVIADKIARMLNGDPDYLDNWHDIIGYATLVEKRLKAKQASPTPL